MKKQVLIPAGIFMLLSLSFSACKKENSNKNVTSSFFENTLWLGEFDAPDAHDQPVSIEFKVNGNVTWHDISGERPGSWSVENNKVNVSIAGQGTFRANVSRDNKLTDIERAADSRWTKVSAVLDTTEAPSLAGTTWEGANVLMYFGGDGVLGIRIGPADYGTTYVTQYERKAKTIRFTIHSSSAWQWFLINDNTSMLRGVNQFAGDSVYAFKIVKK